ncbi:hypothetical protein HY468_01810 [Candidatus Roizmanbacteria bacterium]|nr:hypothetical protein [Candidatus Roizmanbacteria bacterium]
MRKSNNTTRSATDNKTVNGWALVLVGIVFLFDKFGLFRIFGVGIGGFIGMFWPLILIGFGIVSVRQKEINTGIVLLVVGTALQMSQLLRPSFWSMVWPLVLIGIGAFIVMREK